MSDYCKCGLQIMGNSSNYYRCHCGTNWVYDYKLGCYVLNNKKTRDAIAEANKISEANNG